MSKKDLPLGLIKAFEKVVRADFAEKEYKVYEKEAQKYLGKKFDDKIEQGRLVVSLSRALREQCPKSEKRKSRKNKGTGSQSGLGSESPAQLKTRKKKATEKSVESR